MSRFIPRIPIVSTLSLLLLAAVIVLWCRSPRHADLVTFYTPAGHLAGLASERTGVLLCTTEIPFGSEMGLSAQTMSASRNEFGPIHDLLFDPSNEKFHFLGFHTATGTVGTWNWKFNALIVPYWALIIPLVVLPLMGFRRLLIRHRRKRRGQCLACGYDLRHSPERCPECGRPANNSARVKAANEPEPPRNFATAGVPAWLVVGLLIATSVVALTHGRHAAAIAATAPPERSVLERFVGGIDFPSTTPMDSIAALARASGTKIEVSGIELPSLVQSEPTFPLMGMRLNSALRTACLGTGEDEAPIFQIWARGPVVYLGPPLQAPRFARWYPVAPLVHDMQTYLHHDARKQARGSADDNSQDDGDITQTPAAHREIVTLLRALRSGGGKEGMVLYPQSLKR